jgi:tyrosyl-tRNA synthetase
MYSKLEKTPDSLLKDYFELLTPLDLSQLPDNPRQCQKLLALEVTTQFHGQQQAIAAQQTAEAIVIQGKAANTESVPEFSLTDITFPVKLAYLLGASGLCPSSSEGRRQIKGGAVKLDGDRLEDENQEYADPEMLINKVLQVGKKKFIRLIA